MEKIVIIGASGAGKTTLARELGALLGIKVYHLDRLFWDRHWREKDRETRIDILQKLVMEKQWIIEGTYFGSSQPKLEAADTIIFLDIPLWLCLLHVFIRHYHYRQRSRRDLPDGCKDKLRLPYLGKLLLFPLRDRREIIQKLRSYEPSKQIIRLRSSKDVADFLSLQKRDQDNKERSISRAVSATKGKSLLATS